ncbi:MAG: ABC transporter permease [Planctomycetes bacterium]|nr:ABC transporter permease [Planctomycetota bacterium]
MLMIAMRMLMGDKARYVGLVIGVTFAALLMTQQAAIFLGLTTRTYSFVTDTPGPDLWIMDPEVEHVADSKPMLQTQLYRIRGVEGVEWAVPMYRAFAKLRLPNGKTRSCIITGLDDATLFGAPREIVEGSVEQLRQPDSILIDAAQSGTRLVWAGADGVERALGVGDSIELNDRRAKVVGTYRISPSFFWEPTIYTTFTRALTFMPQERRTLTFILVKLKAGADAKDVAAGIRASTGMSAHRPEEFKRLTAEYILTKTGILVNFGLAVGLGFLIGMLVTGQTFYHFTLDNLRHFAALKAMGASSSVLVGMIVAQALLVGLIGYGLGVGGAAAMGGVLDAGGLAFHLPWSLLVFTGVAVLGVSVCASLLSIRRVLVVDPASVFKS